MSTDTTLETTFKQVKGNRLLQTMHAAVLRQFGDPDVLRFEEIETPRPKPGHIVIKVLAAGVNRLDHYLREGSVLPNLPLPHILGVDAVGEVVELGEGVTNPRIGERVIPLAGYTLREDDDRNRPLALSSSFVVPGVHVWGGSSRRWIGPFRSARPRSRIDCWPPIT